MAIGRVATDERPGRLEAALCVRVGDQSERHDPGDEDTTGCECRVPCECWVRVRGAKMGSGNSAKIDASRQQINTSSDHERSSLYLRPHLITSLV
ncbi:MAG: hypothetical protein OEW19_00145 [Acidobacteriota bacterium]|nr:hypothetical protein [Acidobacteriota bacterium]